ncbi:molybdopterin-dependent oxidoreductase [Patulibacter minatonensis]|uniref:molybdopterin-dependent oxidoreductase n=1 Tax=Patulibacter minatonensis TaxID=298163 RepID=UPI000687FBE3|nr:molybdopterin-dependent oxidoreductase [Patulibacter minatonensis]
MSTRTAFRTCPLCEATCGLEVTVQDDRPTKVRGDRRDVFSHGFLCPKGVALGELHEDPDRLRAPLVRRGDRLVECTWDEAFAEVQRLLVPLLDDHGRDACALYLGNPVAHSPGATLYAPLLAKALRSRNVFSASTLDQMPKHVSVGKMFGTALSVPIPDLDRTDHLLVLGANPLASNGSLMTAPNARGRLRAIRARGGRVVVVDPRRSRTAEEADEHVRIRPGGDALLLLAMVHVLFAEERVALGRLGAFTAGVEEVRAAAEPFSPERVAEHCGVAAPDIRRLARELSDAPTAAVYGRLGTCTVPFGTVTSWLVDVLNVLTGNLDREGGALLTTPAIGTQHTRGAPGHGRGMRTGRWTSRVRGLPEAMGELPTAALTEEIETPGDGQVRALITVGGNPARSAPDSGRLEAALAGLDALICVDIYRNETTRHAHVVLPPPSALERDHFDVVFTRLAVRNVANWSPAVLPRDEDAPDEWEILLRLLGVVTGQGPNVDTAMIDRYVAVEAARRESGDEHSPLAGADPEDVVARLVDAHGAPRVGPARLVDLMLRAGPYGRGVADGWVPGTDAAPGDVDSVLAAIRAHGLTLAALEAAPHGVDLGPLRPSLPDALRTPSGSIELAPEEFLADLPRLEATLADPVDPDALVLVGRRHLRSNNSWLHNLPVLTGGPERCTLQLHPDDATRLGIADGSTVRVTSRAGAVDAPAEVTDALRPGVVSLPHGWGHDADGARLGVAGLRPGTNSNVLTDDREVDPLSGTVVLNGIPVTVRAADRAAVSAPAG